VGLSSNWLRLAVASVWALCAATVLYRSLTHDGAWLRRIAIRYRASLRAKLHGPQADRRSTQLLIAQVAAVAIVIVGALWGEVPGPELWLAVGVWGPHRILSKLHARRQRELRAQLPGFLTAMASAVRVRGSPAAALASLPECLSEPLREKVQTVNQAVSLGSSLDDALLDLAERVACPSFNVSVSALLIARRCGGDLPRILESAAAGLREEARLDGVMTARTSEARAQFAVLVVCPFAIIALIGGLSPGYFDPLQGSLAGWAVVVGAGVLWLGALLVARAVLAVGA
jgi:tight adherence protein B